MNYRTVLLAILSPVLLLGPKAHSQNMIIEFNAVGVRVKGNDAIGITGKHRIQPGSKSDWYVLYQTDSLGIKATYKLTSNNSGRSQSKSSSVNLTINYSVDYKGRHQDRKVQKMFFLDDTRAFKGEETFTVELSKYASTVIRLNYQGQLQEDSR